MDLGIKGKIAIVAASSKGIGLAAAKKLAEEGANVVICSRNEENLRIAETELKKASVGEVLAIKCDVTQKADIESLVDKAVDHFGTVHILVNNAGGPPAGYFEDFDDDAWFKAFELNFMSAVRFIRKVLPLMKSQKWGRIINITSVTVKQPIDNLILSNSIRMAVVGLAKTLALQLAEYNITVNNIAPGYTLTSRVRSLVETRAKERGVEFEKIVEELVKEVPAKRMADPSEIGNAVAFLASEAAGYITGVTLFVDGGYVKATL